MRDKGIEERVVKGIAFGMVLHGQGERVWGEPGLLDHMVRRTPGFDFHAVAGPVQSLMVGTVDEWKLNRRAGGVAQGLDIVVFGVVVAGDMEMKRAAQGDVEHLKAAANGEERQLPGERVLQVGEFPGIADLVRIFNQARIRHGLAQEVFRDIGPAGEEKGVHLIGYRFEARVA